MWGIIPAADIGGRVQPLGFSKELVPVGSRVESGGIERPRVVSEYLVERLIKGGATRICFVISPHKSDIIRYFGGSIGGVKICYVVQHQPAGPCDAIFQALPLMEGTEPVMVGLPNTLWFPEDALSYLPSDLLSFLLFAVQKPGLFDAVLMDPNHQVKKIRVKQRNVGTCWIWGAFKAPAVIFRLLHDLWRTRCERDRCIGTLVNAYLEGGGKALGIPAGQDFVDVGTLHGYRQAIQILERRNQEFVAPPDLVAKPDYPGLFSR